MQQDVGDEEDAHMGAVGEDDDIALVAEAPKPIIRMLKQDGGIWEYVDDFVYPESQSDLIGSVSPRN